MVDFTDDEKKVIQTFLSTLTPDMMLQRFINVIPNLIGTPDPGIPVMKAYFATKSADIQTMIDGLQETKDAQEASLTAQKAVIDKLLLKFQ